MFEMQKEVMVKAVEMAKRFEGDWVARMKMALKMAWVIVKKQVTIIVKRPIELIKERLEYFYDDMDFNIWEKYGKVRIYVNDESVKTGYFDFDQEGNIQKWYFDCGYDFDLKRELEASAELMKMGEFM